MMITSGDAGKASVQVKFPCAFSRKGIASNSILCQFYRCCVHKRCSSIRDKLKKDSKFKCWICGNQQIDVAEDCPDIESNS